MKKKVSAVAGTSTSRQRWADRWGASLLFVFLVDVFICMSFDK